MQRDELALEGFEPRRLGLHQAVEALDGREGDAGAVEGEDVAVVGPEAEGDREVLGHWAEVAGRLAPVGPALDRQPEEPRQHLAGVDRLEAFLQGPVAGDRRLPAVAAGAGGGAAL